jgi:hypothetical protein
VIGHLADTGALSRTGDDSQELPLGDLIADAQRADRSTVTGGKTPDIAFMNPGGIRADLQTTGGAVTYGSAFSVQPTSTSRWASPGSRSSRSWTSRGSSRTPRSRGSCRTYTYSHTGSTFALKPETVQVGGAALDPAKTHR